MPTGDPVDASSMQFLASIDDEMGLQPAMPPTIGSNLQHGVQDPFPEYSPTKASVSFSGMEHEELKVSPRFRNSSTTGGLAGTAFVRASASGATI